VKIIYLQYQEQTQLTSWSARIYICRMNISNFTPFWF